MLHFSSLGCPHKNITKILFMTLVKSHVILGLFLKPVYLSLFSRNEKIHELT